MITKSDLDAAFRLIEELSRRRQLMDFPLWGFHSPVVEGGKSVLHLWGEESFNWRSSSLIAAAGEEKE